MVLMMSNKKSNSANFKNEKNTNLADMGIFLLLAVFPLFITNKYYNITISKFIFFISVTVIFFFGCLVFCDRANKTGSLKRYKNFLQWLKDRDELSIAFAAFLILGFVSMLFSPYPFSSFCGYAGRYMGYDFICAVFLLYLFVSRYYRLGEREIIAFEISGILVILLALTEFFGFDFFGLMKTVPESKAGTFLSTIGNINVFASFISLLLPIPIYYLAFSDTSKFNYLFVSATVFGYTGILISNSDSAYLALAAAIWIIGLSVLKSSESTYKFLLTFSLFFLCAFVFGILCKISKRAFLLSDISDIITGTRSVIPFAVLALTALIIKYKPLSKKQLKVLRYIYIVISICLVFTAVFAVVHFSVFDKNTKLNGFMSYLRFNDSWGTKRGMVWRMSISSFLKMPFINKLFGYGEDTVIVLLAKYFKQEMLDSGYYADNAHNEYLQYLLTTGIFGLASYVSLLVISLKNLIKKSREHVICGAVTAAIFTYAVQALVNISQPVTTPLLFLFMAFAGCEIKNNPAEGSHR